MWQPISIPPFCERLIGFSIPQDGLVLVVSYEGTHLIRLGPPAELILTDLEHAEHDLFDSATGLCRYLDRDWQIIGLYDVERTLNLSIPPAVV